MPPDASDFFVGIPERRESTTIHIDAKAVDTLPPAPPALAETDYALIIELDNGVLKLKHDGTVELSGGLKKKDIPRIIQQAARAVYHTFSTRG